MNMIMSKFVHGTRALMHTHRIIPGWFSVEEPMFALVTSIDFVSGLDVEVPEDAGKLSVSFCPRGGVSPDFPLR